MLSACCYRWCDVRCKRLDDRKQTEVRRPVRMRSGAALTSGQWCQSGWFSLLEAAVLFVCWFLFIQYACTKYTFLNAILWTTNGTDCEDRLALFIGRNEICHHDTFNVYMSQDGLLRGVEFFCLSYSGSNYARVKPFWRICLICRARQCRVMKSRT